MSKEISIYDDERYRVDRQDIINAELPNFDPNGRFRPLAHEAMAQQVETLIGELGHTITENSFYMTEDHMRAIGLYQFQSDSSSDFANTVLFFNSNDRQSATKMAAGKLTFACLNACITGEMVYKTMHTKHIESRLPDLLGEAITKIGGYIQHQEKVHETYCTIGVEPNTRPLPEDGPVCKTRRQERVDHIIAEATRQRIIAGSAGRTVEHHFWNPEHKVFARDYTLNRLFQAFTSTFQEKKYSFKRMSQGSIKLHRILNTVYRAEIRQFDAERSWETFKQGQNLNF